VMIALWLTQAAGMPQPAKLMRPRSCVHNCEENGHEHNVVINTKPHGVSPRSPDRLLTGGEQALLSSVKYKEIGGNQQGKLDHLDRLKERMLARLQGQILVETTFRYYSPVEVHSDEVALVGSWAQWVMLHDMDKVADKVWELSINLPPGQHQFKFLVNGEWRLSPAYLKVDDGVGTDGNNAIIVAEPDKEAGGLALRQLEQWLSGVGLTGDVLDRFVEVWLWKHCPC